jgi:hypothetical protein
MRTELLLLLLALLAGAVLLWWWRRPSSSARLKARYLQALKLPPEQAHEVLQRQLERLVARYPGRPLAWYLDFLLRELERDRR